MQTSVGPVDGRMADGVRLAFSKAEASAALGVSVDFFEQHVMPELRIVRRGRRRLIPLAELERWLTENASMVLAS
jgi:excisionase family DNA binding protein